MAFLTMPMSKTYVLHNSSLSPVVRYQVASRYGNAQAVCILEKLQLGVHGAEAVHGWKGESDIRRSIYVHFRFLQL